MKVPDAINGYLRQNPCNSSLHRGPFCLNSVVRIRRRFRFSRSNYATTPATLFPSGLPSPVHASHPCDAEKAPLFPCEMSCKALGFL